MGETVSSAQQKACDEGRSPRTCGPALPGGHSRVPGACDDSWEGVRSPRGGASSLATRWSLESMKLLRCSLLVARFPLPPRQNRRRLHAHTHTHTQGHTHPCVHLGVQQLRGGVSKLEGKAAASKTRGKLSATPLPSPTAGARLLSGAFHPELGVCSRNAPLSVERPGPLPARPSGCPS